MLTWILFTLPPSAWWRPAGFLLSGSTFVSVYNCVAVVPVASPEGVGSVRTDSTGPLSGQDKRIHLLHSRLAHLALPLLLPLPHQHHHIHLRQTRRPMNVFRFHTEVILNCCCDVSEGFNF